jgi:hypothetical protein
MGQEIEIYKKAEIAIQNAHGIYLGHEQRYLNATAAVDKFLKGAATGMDASKYANAAALLKKLDATRKAFNEERSPVTQAANAIVSAFTSQENGLDYRKEGTGANKVKKLMDAYAAQQAAEQRAQQEKQRREIEKKREANAFRLSVKSMLERLCTEAEQEMKSNISAALNSVTLENYGEIKEQLKVFDIKIPEALFYGAQAEMPTTYLTDKEKEGIADEVKGLLDFAEFKAKYEQGVNIFLHESLAKMPTIQKELQDIADAEADKKLQAELKKQRELRQQAEEKEREEEKAQLEKEIDEKQGLGMEQAGLQAQFEAAANDAAPQAPVKAQKEYGIMVEMPAGLMDLLRFWAAGQDWPQEEGAVMRMTIGRMKKFAEKEASNGNFIESGFIEYKEIITSKV